MPPLNTLSHMLSKTEFVNGCTVWTGCVNAGGYGITQYRSEPWLAHRLVWFFTYGSVPDELDHLCRVRNCVEVAHLEAVTHEENNYRAKARRSCCRRGHEYTKDNVYIIPSSGRRVCRTCKTAGRVEEHRRRRERRALRNVRDIPEDQR